MSRFVFKSRFAFQLVVFCHKQDNGQGRRWKRSGDYLYFNFFRFDWIDKDIVRNVYRDKLDRRPTAVLERKWLGQWVLDGWGKSSGMSGKFLGEFVDQFDRDRNVGGGLLQELDAKSESFAFV